MERSEEKETIRTDLAVEAKDMVEADPENTEDQPKNQGVAVEHEDVDGIDLVHVTIDPEAEERMGKKAGHYVTFEAQGIRDKNTELQRKLIRTFSGTIADYFEKKGIQPDHSCLIIGLGNRDVTPDALGPKTVEEIMVTRHLFKEAPEHVEEGYRPVSAMAPGVMGVTGMETSDIIEALVERARPDFVIAIDALASRSLERVNATIQVSDAGIHPGAGVQNERKQVNEETLGVPVIAIGIPTVVDAVSITSDTIDFLIKHIGKEMSEGDAPGRNLAPAGLTFGEKPELSEEHIPQAENRQAVLGLVGGLDEEEKRQLIREVLGPLGHNLMVTPKEVDTFMSDMAHVLAQGLNAALHEAVTPESAGAYTR
ncbi:GPR endopeptidase [Salsuginibacillus kocurii]|uniref:GPR endopeptidase n=1 Tax=Salsuginibacillus kocurii TaxID=427078 RepID=UPI0003801B04|nr:GPR endopeptidase [Salsuginibacillus kocurii]